MQKLLLLAIALILSSVAAVAEQPRPHKPYKVAPSGKELPLKRPNSTNACAEYGAGFVRVEGTGTCVKIGGAVSIGAGVSSGPR
ncbi:hypothetical protein [Bradyrhizobium sp. BWA-3-5]|uniref:hypothetical protein n=1 Tax=Bradyrhizobium sp. BWA-3-5 TaxID=3080013 RepID=UPI00293EBCB9|nr:hypothetical protein [Bradyrhizobium sp. BWA-3-5]WOH63023.1 hypothetical protein RX331_19990 [Bradyrhizobium sp. BWA-3-5]